MSEMFSIKDGASLWVTFSSSQWTYYWGNTIAFLSMGPVSITWCDFDAEHMLSIWPVILDQQSVIWEVLQTMAKGEVDHLSGQSLVDALEESLRQFEAMDDTEFIERLEQEIEARKE